MFTIESSDTTNAPAAAIQRVISCMMTRLHGVVEFAVVKILSALIFPLFLLAGCATESPEDKAATLLRQAEAAMEECKGANIIRLKVTCRGALEELIAAKQARAQPR